MAQSDIATHEFVPACADVEIAAKTGLDDMIVPDRAESRSLLGLVEAIEDIVILQLHANCDVRTITIDMGVPGVARIETACDTLIGLTELITVDRVIHEVGKVGEQVELAVNYISADLTRLITIGATPSTG